MTSVSSMHPDYQMYGRCEAALQRHRRVAVLVLWREYLQCGGSEDHGHVINVASRQPFAAGLRGFPVFDLGSHTTSIRKTRPKLFLAVDAEYLADPTCHEEHSVAHSIRNRGRTRPRGDGNYGLVWSWPSGRWAGRLRKPATSQLSQSLQGLIALMSVETHSEWQLHAESALALEVPVDPPARGQCA